MLNRSSQEKRSERATAIIDTMNDRLEFLADEEEDDYDDDELDELKLRAIIRGVQDLEVLHTFTDGNCRTMVFCVLNKLLLQNGFDPVIMLNPNRLDGLSEDQLIAEILDGQQRFRDVRDG